VGTCDGELDAGTNLSIVAETSDALRALGVSQSPLLRLSSWGPKAVPVRVRRDCRHYAL